MRLCIEGVSYRSLRSDCASAARLDDSGQDADALVQVVEHELAQLGLLAGLDLGLLLAPDLFDCLLREVLAHQLVLNLRGCIAQCLNANVCVYSPGEAFVKSESEQLMYDCTHVQFDQRGLMSFWKARREWSLIRAKRRG